MIMKFISSSTPLKGLCSTMKRQLISRWGLLFQQIIIWQSKGTESCTKFKIFQIAPSNLASTHWSKAAPRFRKNVRKVIFKKKKIGVVKISTLQIAKSVFVLPKYFILLGFTRESHVFIRRDCRKNTFECFPPAFGGVFVFWKVLLWSEVSEALQFAQKRINWANCDISETAFLSQQLKLETWHTSTMLRFTQWK